MTAEGWIALALLWVVLSCAFIAGACRLSGRSDDAMDAIIGDLPNLPRGASRHHGDVSK